MRLIALVSLALLIGGAEGLPSATPAFNVAALPPKADGFVRPVDGPVIRPFQPGEHRYAAGHRGADLAASESSIVRAAGSGTVAAAGVVAGRPVVSIVHTGGLRTTYEPIVPRVRTGQHVTTGQPIGVLLPGHAGCAHEACLHWGLRRSAPDGEKYLDPLLLLGAGTVRLKPLQPGDVP